MLGAVADGGAGFVVMHMQGTPETMQDDPRYDDVVDDVSDALVAGLDAARRAGVDEGALLADPGIGFGKTAAHNLELLSALPTLARRVGVPLVVGASRKRFLAAYSAGGDAADRDDATLATSVWSFARGARMVRVHDVVGSVAAARVMEARA
jgi:dihydropteroate synthase